MKKLLALVLALVMTLGLATVGTSAAYSDADSINYKEAVDVMSAIGVLQGDNGAFNPTGTLTREQGAKIITYMLLGKTAADALTTPSAPFADVAADRWSAGSIEFCRVNGIIDGVGGGKFNPTGTLTGYQFGKMLLTSLGYSAKIEGLTGADYTTNVARLLQSTGLYNGISGFVGSQNLAREAAAQMAMNTLKTTMVEYNGGVSVSTTDGTDVTVDATRTNVPNNNPATDGNIDKSDVTLAGARNDGLMQFGENYFPTLKLTLATNGGTDEFDRPANVWELGTKTVSASALKSVATFTAKTTAANVYKALKGYKVFMDYGDNGAGVGDVYVPITNEVAAANVLNSALTYYDGTTLYQLLTANGNTTLAKVRTAVAGDSLATTIAGLTANGKLVEVFANSDNQITRIATQTYTVGKVTTVSTNSSGDVTYTIDGITMRDYADDNLDDTIVLPAGATLAKGDYVTYVQNVNDNVYHVYPTTKVTGTQTSTDAKKITVGGTSYTIGNGVTKYNNYVYTNTKKDADYFIDQYNFVVASADVETTASYAVVDRIVGVTATGVSGTNSATAIMVFADGSKETVKVSKINGMKTSAINIEPTAGNGDYFTMTSDNAAISITLNTNVASNTRFNGYIVSYTKDSDGNYEIVYPYGYRTAYASVGAAGAKTLVSKGVPAVPAAAADLTAGTSAKGDNNTVYIVKTTNSAGNSVFTAYTGFTNVASVAAKAGSTLTAKYVNDSNGYADMVYVDASVNSDVGDDVARNVFYVTSATVTTHSTGTETYYTIEGILNGEVYTAKSKSATFYSSTGAALTDDTFYELTINADGYTTLANAVLNNIFDATRQGVLVTPSIVTGVSNGSFDGMIVGDDTKVYVINDDVITVGDASSAGDGDVYYAKTPTTGTSVQQNTATYLYIIKETTSRILFTTDAAINAALASNSSVTVDASGTTLALDGTTITVGNGKTLNLYATTVDATATETTIQVDKGGTLNIYGAFATGDTNATTVNGTLNVTGTLTTGNDNMLVVNGGTVNVTGGSSQSGNHAIAVTNSGALNVDGAIAGKITVNTAGSVKAGTTIAEVTSITAGSIKATTITTLATLDVSGTQTGAITIDANIAAMTTKDIKSKASMNGITINGNVTTGAATTIDPAAGTTITISGNIDTGSNGIDCTTSAGTVVIDGNVDKVADVDTATVTINGNVADVTDITSGTVTFNGNITTAVADVSGGTVTFNGTVTNLTDITGTANITINGDCVTPGAKNFTSAGNVKLGANAVWTFGTTGNDVAIDLDALVFTAEAGAKIIVNDDGQIAGAQGIFYAHGSAVAIADGTGLTTDKTAKTYVYGALSAAPATSGFEATA